MKYHGILKWFKKKNKSNQIISQAPKKEVIATKNENDLSKNNIEQKKNQTNEKAKPIEVEKDTITPIISQDKKKNQTSLPDHKELEKNLSPINTIIDNNERDTLIKPQKSEPIEPIIEEETSVQEQDEAIKTNSEAPNKNDVVIKINTLDELEKMIRKTDYEVKKIQYELKVLEQKEQDELTAKEIDDLIYELNKLIQQFEQIKKEFYQNHYEELYKFPNNDNYMHHLIEEYKTAINDNDKSPSILQIKQINEYITMINKIIEIDTKKDKLEQKLDDKKSKLDDKENEFEKLKDNYNDIDKLNKYITSFIEEQDHILKDIESKVNNAENITKKAEYKTELAVNYTRLLTSTLLMATTSIIPSTKAGNILKLGLMTASIAGLASAIRTRTKESKVITKVSFIDYCQEIKNSINNVEDMALTIDQAILDITFLKKDLQKEFEEYRSVIPEYYDIIMKLDTIEKDLNIKQQVAKDYDKKIKNVLDKNNVKVKRLEEEYPN